MGVVKNVIGSSVDVAKHKLFPKSIVDGVEAGYATMAKGGKETLKNKKADLANAIKATGAEGDAVKQLPEYQHVLTAEKERADQIVDGFGQMGRAGRDWLTGADAAAAGNSRTMALLKRYGSMAGASVALGTGGRMLTGGSLTQDNRGRQDIAGIPFI